VHVHVCTHHACACVGVGDGVACVQCMHACMYVSAHAYMLACMRMYMYACIMHVRVCKCG
jgi:hypothetical protein